MAIQHIGQVQQHNSHFILRTRRKLERGMNIFGQFLFNFWSHILTAILGLIVAAAIAVPILSYFGLDSISKPIFYSMHFICAQVPAHSFYIFGHQLGLCARNLSIYASMFAGSLVFTWSKKRLPGLPWWAWLIFILPMAWDGITQMFGWRESSWELRVLTGTLFGLANVLFVLPMIQKALLETPMYLTPAQNSQSAPAQAIPSTTQVYVASTQESVPSLPATIPQRRLGQHYPLQPVTSSVPSEEGHAIQAETSAGS